MIIANTNRIWSEFYELMPESYRDPNAEIEQVDATHAVWLRTAYAFGSLQEALNGISAFLDEKIREADSIKLREDFARGIVTIDDETRTLEEWQCDYGNPPALVRERVSSGMDYEVAIIRPMDTDELDRYPDCRITPGDCRAGS